MVLEPLDMYRAVGLRKTLNNSKQDILALKSYLDRRSMDFAITTFDFDLVVQLKSSENVRRAHSKRKNSESLIW